MVELRLPKNSRVTEGITWEKPSDAENVQETEGGHAVSGMRLTHFLL